MRSVTTLRHRIRRTVSFPCRADQPAEGRLLSGRRHERSSVEPVPPTVAESASKPHNHRERTGQSHHHRIQRQRAIRFGKTVSFQPADQIKREMNQEPTQHTGGCASGRGPWPVQSQSHRSKKAGGQSTADIHDQILQKFRRLSAANTTPTPTISVQR